MPDEEIEVKEIEVPEGTPNFFDVETSAPPEPVATEPPAETPPPASEPSAPEPSTPAAPGAQPTPPAAPELPEWLNEIAEADRPAVLERMLSTLTPEQRANLAPVREIADWQASNAVQQALQQTQQISEAEQRMESLIGEANVLYDDILNGNVDADSLPARLSDYAEVAAFTRQSEIGEEIRQAIEGVATSMGLRELPGQVVQAASQANGYGPTLATYMNYLINTAYQAGQGVGVSNTQKSVKADQAASEARMRNKVLGELAKEKRIKIDADGFAEIMNDVAPPISGTPALGGGDMDQAEFDQIMNDQDAYNRAMADPVKGPQLTRMFRQALGAGAK